MKYLRDWMKFAVISGLISQLLMAAFMTPMTLDRAKLQAAQNSFYAAVGASASQAQAETPYYICVTDTGSGIDLENCQICEALLGAGYCTLPSAPLLAVHTAIPTKNLLPASSTLTAQDHLLRRAIRGPPVSA